jgi:GNAT superfamily N-acetyltransferase
VEELEDTAEAIDGAALKSWYDTLGSIGARVKTARDGRVLAACMEGTSDPMLNRVFELGLGLPATRAGVDALLGWFRAHDVSRYLMHVSPSAGPPELREWLLESGLRRHRSWMKFARGRDAVSRPKSSLAPRLIGVEHGGVFGRIVCDAFDMPDETAPLLSRLVGRAGWHLFMSFDGETPAGTGALFVSDGVGWLGFGATKPEFRGRGAQAAVLAARIETALDLGCRVIITETGEAVPGDKQHSYKNILKAGFRELYLRENFSGNTASP